MVKAAFSMASDSAPASRSTSRDRIPPPPAPSSLLNQSTPPLHTPSYLSNLDEESTLESTGNPRILPRPRIALDSDTEAEGTESDHLLSSSVSSYRNQRGRRTKRKHTLSIDRKGNGYGSMTHQITQTNGWVSLNEDGGRPLQRQESVLKVSHTLSPHIQFEAN